ncbi:MAG: glutamate--tRNA ligase [Caldilineaceae bacterium]|nr:glutamate--tRNA ligase [Caldilineaceae bacterium]
MASSSIPARVRFAPSPTGYLHLGGLRTALFGWLHARHTGGQFILRIEDTDQKRFDPASLEDVKRSLRWLGLDWDEGPDVGGPYGPYVQSERKEIYGRYAQQLIDQGDAYRCYATAEELEAMRTEQRARGQVQGYDRRHRYLSAEERAAFEAEGRPSVVRFAAPLDGTTAVHDLIRGEIEVENSQVMDPVLLKSDGMPTYHLAVVVDDHLMEITHVLRGEEWISSAPLHVLLYAAFDWESPQFIHLPVILDPSGKGKMSKRKQVVAGKNIWRWSTNLSRLATCPRPCSIFWSTWVGTSTPSGKSSPATRPLPALMSARSTRPQRPCPTPSWSGSTASTSARWNRRRSTTCR